MLGLDNSPGLSFIVDTDNFVSQLELLPSASWRQGLQYRDLSLTVNAMAVVQVGDTRDLDSLLACIEVNDLLIGELECWKVTR